ncbi:MAG: flagellar basal body-associated FliL family protein [Rhodospirillaceae bacterium]|nr:flagellar basal body-associated FliL family protein [Rhodospirillaceae bacterium]
MAQEPEEDFDGEAEPEFEGGQDGGSKKKLLLMIVVPLVLVIGGAAGAYFSGLADPLIAMITGDPPEEEMAAEGESAATPAPEGGAPAEGAPGAPGANTGAFYDLPEMLVNLNTPGRKRNFLKIRVTLELANEADINRIELVLPRIVDSTQVYLRELRLEDLQGAAGVYRLREELLSRVNVAVRPTQVKDVLFKEMIVQ